MTRVVESIAPEYGNTLRWEKIITRDLKGALRYHELSKAMGRPVPVPSIFINGKLYFETTPGREELRDCLNKLIGTDRDL